MSTLVVACVEIFVTKSRRNQFSRISVAVICVSDGLVQPLQHGLIFREPHCFWSVLVVNLLCIEPVKRLREDFARSVVVESVH
jgi:hypothetical protein